MANLWLDIAENKKAVPSASKSGGNFWLDIATETMPIKPEPQAEAQPMPTPRFNPATIDVPSKSWKDYLPSWSSTKKTAKQVGGYAAELPVGAYNMFGKPSETTKQLEQQVVPTPGSGVERAVSAPLRFVVKGATRLLNPAVEGLGTQIANIYFTNEEADKLAKTTKFQTVGGQVQPENIISNNGKLTAADYVETVINSTNVGLPIAGLLTDFFGFTGNKLTTRGTKIEVTPEQIRTVLDAEVPMPPQARGVLESLADNNQGFNMEFKAPAGGIRQTIGEVLQGQKVGSTVASDYKITKTGEAIPKLNEPLGYKPPTTSLVEQFTSEAGGKIKPMTSSIPEVKPGMPLSVVAQFGSKVQPKVEQVSTKPLVDQFAEDLTLQARKVDDKTATQYREIVSKILQDKPAFSKTQVATLLRNVPEFKENPVLTVNEKGNLSFAGQTTKFEIVPKALGLLPKESFKIGQQIRVNTQDFLKPDKEKTNIRVMQGDNIFASKGTTAIGEFEKTGTQAEGKPFKLFEKTQEFIKKYAGMFGEGYNPKGTAGVFYKPSTNIFIKGRNDISTAAHEVTHYVDQQMGISEKVKQQSKANDEIREGLTDVYVSFYPGGSKKHPLKTRIVEGLATFLQKYMENPTEMRVLYPELVNSFLKEGGDYYHAVMPEMVKDLRSIVDEYQSLDPLSQVGSRVQSGKTQYDKNTFLNVGEKIYQQLFDDIYPFEKMAESQGKGMTQQDLSLWTRLYQNHVNMAHNNILGRHGYYTMNNNGEFYKKFNFNWKSLVKDLSKAKLTEDFGHYLVARRTYFTYRQLFELKKLMKEVEIKYKKDPENPDFKASYEVVKKDYDDLKSVLENDGITDAEATAAYEQNKDKFKEYEKTFDQLTRTDLEFLHNERVQLVNQSEFANLTSNEGYAPFQREIFNEILGEQSTEVATARIGGGKVSSLIKRKGSSKAILNPLFSAMKNHSEIMKKGLQQIVYNQLLDNAGAFSEFLQPIPLEKSINPQNGQVYFPQSKDPNIVMARRDYKRVPILVNNEIIRGVLNDVFTYQNVGVIGQIWQSFARIFTKGTTAAYAPFAITNTTVDQITAAANTMNNYIPIYDGLKNIGKVIAKRDSLEAEYFAEYMFLGGERQTYVTWQDRSPEQIFEIINNEKKGLMKVVRWLETGASWASVPSKYSEIFTRATEYIKARKAGKHQVVALEQAGQVSIPFHHMGKLGGSLGRTWIRSVPFANPGFQALGILIKRMGTKEGARRYLFVAAALMAAMIADLMYIASKASDDQKRQYKDLDPKMLSKYIYLPKPGGKDFYRIRVPDNLATPGSIVNMIISDKILNTNYTAGEYLTTSTAFLPDQLNPTEPVSQILSMLPQAFKPGMQVALNRKDFPRVSDIEPQSLQNLPAGYRYTEQTSALAKWIGRHTGLSPIKTDFLITGYLGRATGPLIMKPGVYNPLAGMNQQYYFQTGRTMQQYYDIRQDILEGKTAFKKLGKEVEIDPGKIAVAAAKIKIVDKLMGFYQKIDVKENPQQAVELRDQILSNVEEMVEEWND